MPFLGVDTATSRGSIALVSSGRVLVETQLEERARHARDLLLRIDRLLQGIGAGPDDLLGIGVAVGPGSFTGVRIGMATGKGLAYALQIGLAGLSTLQALALAARMGLDERFMTIGPAIDAGRGEIYWALFRTEGDRLVREGPDRSSAPAEVARSLPPRTALVGDGSAAILRETGAGGRDIRPIEPCPLLAGAIAIWASREIAPGTGYRVESLAPNYLRPSYAEAKRRP